MISMIEHPDVAEEVLVEGVLDDLGLDLSPEEIAGFKEEYQDAIKMWMEESFLETPS